jgi:hypothetical protein
MSRASGSDREFRRAFERGEVPAAEFGHRAHLRLAYVYLSESAADEALAAMRAALAVFLARNRIDPARYHETLTRAWVAAVSHFMEGSPETASFDELAVQQPRMLDPQVMLTHYSRERLFSAEARAGFVTPDRDPLPGYPTGSAGTESKSPVRR